MEIELSAGERYELERIARSATAQHRYVIRAKLILRLAAGHSVSAVARAVGRQRRIVRQWGKRFIHKRLKGLHDLPRSGRPASFSPGGGRAPGQARMPAT